MRLVESAIDTAPWKLGTEKLVVRSIEDERKVFEVVPTDGLKLEDLVTQLLADRRVARLNIHLLCGARSAF